MALIARSIVVSIFPRWSQCRAWWIAALLIASATSAVAAPATQPKTSAATQPTAAPASQPSPQDLRKIAELIHQSITLLEAKKYDQAEKVLQEVLEIDPRSPVNLYNMACLLSLEGRKDMAIKFLEKSTQCGFTDFEHIAHDADLEPLHGDPRFQALLDHKDEIQRHAAEQAVADLKQQFGATYLYEIDDADKLIFATNTDQTTLEALKKGLIAQAHSQWDQLFSHRPNQYICVVVLSKADYKKLVPLRGVEGFYSPSNHTLICDGMGFVTRHEFTHALHWGDIEETNQEPQIWVLEGLAVLFERTEWDGPPDKQVFTPLDNFRLFGLQHSVRAGHLIPFSHLITESQQEFVHGNVMLAYAESGSIMHYLYAHGKLRKFYDAYARNYVVDPTGKLALEQASGLKLDDLQKDWKKWMLARIPPLLNTGPNGVYMGLGLDQATDGILIWRVAADSPAAKAGLKEGDEIIGLNSVEARDTLSFMPMVAEHKVGETITLRIHRGDKYFDVEVTLIKRPPGESPSPRGGDAVPSNEAVRPPTTRP
jgi:hypothetical protein